VLLANNVEYENIRSYKKIIIHQLLGMTFNKIETSYVAYSQKRAAYVHKGSGWHLSERQVWRVQDGLFLPATSASYCSFILDL
jgi:hypothetical protein